MSRQSLVKTKSFLVTTEYFYVAKVKIIYVGIEYFCVTIEFCNLCRDRIPLSRARLCRACFSVVCASLSCVRLCHARPSL